MRFLTMPVVACVAWAAAAHAADPPSLPEIRRSLDEARSLLDAGKPAKARGALAEAVDQLGSLFEGGRAPSGSRAVVEDCRSLKEDIAFEGVNVDGIEIPAIKSASAQRAISAKAEPAKPAGGVAARAFPGQRPVETSGPGATSFAKQVAPILVAHCGGCHIRGSRGGFQMVSYDGLMKSGFVQRGNPEASRLVEVIESGDMPRGGGRVPPEDLATLKRWIEAGAAGDADPTAGITDFAGQPAGAARAPIPTAPVALKPGDVSFAFEVAPVLLKNCSGCHDENQPEARFSLTTYARLMRGGESGAAVVAGKGADSLIVRKIKGMNIDGQRMPIGKSPLSAEVIATIEQWIDQGAGLDLLKPESRLQQLVSAGRMRSMSHDELREVRFAGARKLWQRALPDENPLVERRGEVLVIGNVKPAQMTLVADAAEAGVVRAQQLLVEDPRPLVKGGTVLFVFASPVDFSTFWQVALADERPKGLLSHAGIVDEIAYGAFLLPQSHGGNEKEELSADLQALSTEQATAAALLVRGAPEWFATGAARMIAAKVAPKSALAKAWRRAPAEQLGQLGAPADFFSGHAGPVATAAIGGGFVTSIARSEARLRDMIAVLDAGTTFDKAFADAFRSPPQPLFAAWLSKESKRGAGKSAGR
jgi:hypothetical protein